MWRWYLDLSQTTLEAESEEIQALYWKSVADDLTRISSVHLQLQESEVPDQAKEDMAAMLENLDDYEKSTKASGSTKDIAYTMFRPSQGIVRIFKESGIPLLKNVKGPLHLIYSFSPSVEVDLRLMGNVAVTCLELLTVRGLVPTYEWQC
jgi:hypothetical protein